MPAPSKPPASTGTAVAATPLLVEPVDVPVVVPVDAPAAVPAGAFVCVAFDASLVMVLTTLPALLVAWIRQHTF